MAEDMPQGKETVSDEEIIQAIKNHDEPFVGAVEIAEYFDHTRQWAHSRLQSLYEGGRLKRKSAGQRSVIWWIEEGEANSGQTT